MPSNQADVDLPWGCSITVDKVSRWPIAAKLNHEMQESGQCGCREIGITDTFLIVDYLKMAAYFKYTDQLPFGADADYHNEDECDNAYECNLLLHAQARSIGLSLDDVGDIWDKYPSCIPTAEEIRGLGYHVPKGTPFRSEMLMSDGNVAVFEGRTLGPNGMSLAEAEAASAERQRKRQAEGCECCLEMPWKVLRRNGATCPH